MTPEVEKKRRELFEVKGLELGLTKGHFNRDEDGNYINYPTECYFEFFNAALDAVEIELPLDPNEEFSDRREAVLACASAITSTGLGLKIKEYAA